MSTKKLQGKITKKEVITKEREEQWRIEPSKGIPAYSAEKDPHCPNGQIRKFNEEKKLKSQILAQREKATATFIKTTLDHSLDDLTDMKYKSGNEVKSKVKTRESYAEIEILQKIVVRENLLVELHRLLKSQNDVSVCLNEVVELIKAMRFQTLDIIEDINAWQQTQPRVRAFEYKGSNYLVKIKCDLDFLDLYEEIVEKFCFEFNSNPLAYRGGGNVITGYSADPRRKAYSQGLLRDYYSKADDALLDGLDTTRLLNAEKIIQNEFQRIGREKGRGQELVQQQAQHAHQSDVLDRDIFNALSKSTNNLHLDSPHHGANKGNTLHAHTADSAGSDGFEVGNTGTGGSGKKTKKHRKGGKSSATLNPKKAKLERISQLQEEASDLKAMMVNVDEKIQFLTDHHHDLLNQRAVLDTRLKDAKALGREVAATHIAAEISVNTAVVLDNSTKVKDLQRESYFINLERKRKLGTVQKLKEELEKEKERAALQKKIGSMIKKEGLMAALASFHTKDTKITATEIALIGEKSDSTLLARPKSAGVKSSSPPKPSGMNGSPPKSAGKNRRAGSEGKDVSPTTHTNSATHTSNGMNHSASAPALGTTQLPPLHASSRSNMMQQNYVDNTNITYNNADHHVNHHNNYAYENSNFDNTIYEEGEEGDGSGDEEEEGGEEGSGGEEGDGEGSGEEENGEEGGQDNSQDPLQYESNEGGGEYVNADTSYDSGVGGTSGMYGGDGSGGDNGGVYGEYGQPVYQQDELNRYAQYDQYGNYTQQQPQQQLYSTEDQQYSQHQQQYATQYTQERGTDSAYQHEQGSHYSHNTDEGLYQYSHDSHSHNSHIPIEHTDHSLNADSYTSDYTYINNASSASIASEAHNAHNNAYEVHIDVTDAHSYADSHTDSHAESHEGDTLYGEHLLDSHSHLSHATADDDLSLQISPIRNTNTSSTSSHYYQDSHNPQSHAYHNAYVSSPHHMLSPSEGSYGSKESPLGYSINSLTSLGDVSAIHPHEMHYQHPSEHYGDHHGEHYSSAGILPRGQFEQNEGGGEGEHMYISDDEEHHSESEQHPSGHKHSGAGSGAKGVSPKQPSHARHRQEPTNTHREQPSAVSQLDVSDLSMSLMMPVHHYNQQAELNTSLEQEDNTNRQLFGDSVSLDGASDGDYPAGGAYGLVKKLKLSPRPA